MKILNLIDLGQSDIKYEIQRFPDGQQNIVISTSYVDDYINLRGSDSINPPIFCAITSKITSHLEVIIKSRLNNWKDLELIVCAVASLREIGVTKIQLFVPYIVGARSDRKFEEGGNNYLRDVICPIINSLNFKTVTCIDPHSDVLEACIKRFRKEDNKKLIEFGLSQIYYNESYKDISIRNNFKDFILISPDAGASKKIYKVAEQIGYKGDIITCSKDRDENGKLTKIKVPGLGGDQYGKDIIIIDDICDGGATFINIVKALKSQGVITENTTSKIYLIVTHGIFSKGFEELSKYFDGIYCTNSYRQINNSLNFGASKDFVKQLNIF